jgi:hypothetical protein
MGAGGLVRGAGVGDSCASMRLSELIETSELGFGKGRGMGSIKQVNSFVSFRWAEKWLRLVFSLWVRSQGPCQTRSAPQFKM